MNFTWPARVYYEDTDSGGVVYYANYLKFMERARTEYLRHFGVEQDVLINNENIIFAVRHINIDYHKPAFFNDLLLVSAQVTEYRKVSMVFSQSVVRDAGQQLLCSGTVCIVSLHADTLKPCKIPQSILEVISGN
jgi:acyl-CoA thioester hydrolase